MDRKAYDGLKKVYTDSLGKLYDRDIRTLFEMAKERVSRKFWVIMKEYQLSKFKIITATGQVASPIRSISLLGQDREQWILEISTVERNKFESTLEQVLTQLEPICLQEQQFCVSFFQVN